MNKFVFLPIAILLAGSLFGNAYLVKQNVNQQEGIRALREDLIQPLPADCHARDARHLQCRVCIDDPEGNGKRCTVIEVNRSTFAQKDKP